MQQYVFHYILENVRVCKKIKSAERITLIPKASEGFRELLVYNKKVFLNQRLDLKDVIKINCYSLFPIISFYYYFTSKDKQYNKVAEVA